MGRNILGIFDGGDVQEISALIDKLEKSSFDYLKLEGDGMSIVIGKNGVFDVSGAVAVPAASVPVAVAAAHAAAPAVVAAAAVAPASPSDAVAAAEAAAKPAIAEQEGVYIIRAPSMGLFFAQPEPGAPPYVSVGTEVKTGDTVCLIEIMKTYSALTSPVDGTVIAVHVVNEEYLEADQPLISIKVK